MNHSVNDEFLFSSLDELRATILALRTRVINLEDQLSRSVSDAALSPPEAAQQKDTWSYFNRLPLELRNQIWRMTLPERTIIELRFEGDIIVPTISYPVSFHVNRESRAEATRSHQKLLFYQGETRGQRYIYFLPGRDVIRVQ